MNYGKGRIYRSVLAIFVLIMAMPFFCLADDPPSLTKKPIVATGSFISGSVIVVTGITFDKSLVGVERSYTATIQGVFPSNTVFDITYTDPYGVSRSVQGWQTGMVQIHGPLHGEDYPQGIYTITSISVGGVVKWTGAASITIVAPVAVIEADKTAGVAPLTVNFSGEKSTNLAGTIVAYAWNFGDGTNGSGTTVSHTYATAGTYTTQLTVTDDVGVTSYATVTITVNETLTVTGISFDKSQVTVGQSYTAIISGNFPATTVFDVTYTDQATGAEQYVAAWQTGASAVHTVPPGMATGTYTITAISVGGVVKWTGAASITVVAVNNAPQAVIETSTTSGIAPLSVNFSGAKSTDSDGTIVTYAWVFGDGTSGSGATISHTYTSTGTYTARLTVIDDDGAASHATVTITVEEALTVTGIGFDKTQVMAGQSYTVTLSGTFPATTVFDVTYTDPSGAEQYVAAWQTGASAAHTVTSAMATGTYTITAISVGGVVKWTGAVSITVVAVPNNAPVAVIEADKSSGTTPMTVHFSAVRSSDSDGTIVDYAWNFGDGTSGSGAITSHTYSSAGTYTARLTVIDDDGAAGHATVTITVEEALTVTGIGFDKTQVMAGQSYTATISGTFPATTVFDVTYTDPSGAEQYVAAWQTGTSAAHTVTSAMATGTYTITAISVGGVVKWTGAASITVVAVPNNAPVAVIEINQSSGTVPLTVNFNGTRSTDSDGTIVSYTWGFGDNGGTTGATVSHTYTTPGTYTAWLTVTDDGGATSQATVTITVEEGVMVTGISFDRTTVTIGGSYTTTIQGTFPTATVFDVTCTEPSGASYTVAGWQTGAIKTHGPLPAGMMLGTYTITSISVGGETKWTGSASIEVVAG